jgi:hypothetical protein
MREAYRKPLIWLAILVVGLGVVIGVVALVGGDDDEGEVVSAAEWADNVCEAVEVRRGTVEEIVTDLRLAGTPQAGDDQQEELRGSFRLALERTVRATQTMVEGIALAGIPDTPGGEQAAEQVSTWADQAVEDLEDAQEALDEDVEDFQESVAVIVDASGAVVETVAGGVQTVVDVAQVDQELGSALRDSEACQMLRGERT